MGWNVGKPRSEAGYTFNKAIPEPPAESEKTWVRIAMSRPGASAILDSALNEATYVYREGRVEQRATVHWEMIKFHLCWLSLIETNFEDDDGKAIFPTRKSPHQMVDREKFERGWVQLLPEEITDEWTAAVLKENSGWFFKLRMYIPLWWMRQWMPEKLEEIENEEPLAAMRLKEDTSESLGEEPSE